MIGSAPIHLLGIPESDWKALADQAEEDMFSLPSACHLLGISPHYYSWQKFTEKDPCCIIECIYLEEPFSVLNPLNSIPKTYKHTEKNIFYKSLSGWTRDLLSKNITPEHIASVFFPPIYRIRELSAIVSLAAEYVEEAMSIKEEDLTSLKLNSCYKKIEILNTRGKELREQIGFEVAKVYRSLL